MDIGSINPNKNTKKHYQETSITHASQYKMFDVVEAAPKHHKTAQKDGCSCPKNPLNFVVLVL